MKDELIIDGIRYKRVAEELTLEDCVKDNVATFTDHGKLTIRDSSENGYGLYPNYAISEKVLLYGLLKSVAHKLNEGKEGLYCICFHDKSLCTTRLCPTNTNYGIVLFASKELAEQAIRIFENSKFDLKKLFQ
jgi:hypothetical protein